MSEPLSLLEFLQGLLSDTGMRDGFLADPHATLTDHGLADLSPADVHDALVLVEDTQTADFSAAFTAGAPGLAGHVPLAPPPDAHSDAVRYLSSYLTGEQPVPYADDLDVDRLAGLDGASWPPDDTADFGMGATTGGHDVDDQFGMPAQLTPADPDADVDLDEATTDSDGADFGAGSDEYSSDQYGDPWVDPDPYGDPGSEPGSAAEHHNNDF